MIRTKYGKLTATQLKTVSIRQSLLLLQIQKPVIKQRAYIRGEFRLRRKPDDLIRQKDIDKILANSEVCCLGLLALASLRKMPEVCYGDLSDFASFDKGVCTVHASRESVLAILRRMFFKTQLDTIEVAFELKLGFRTPTYLSKPEYDAAVAFGSRYTDPVARATAIYEHMMGNRRRIFRPMQEFSKYDLWSNTAA